MSEAAICIYEFGSRVFCSDADCGELLQVVVDPDLPRLTELVVCSVADGAARLVAAELARRTPYGVLLDCDKSAFDRFPTTPAPDTQIRIRRGDHVRALDGDAGRVMGVIVRPEDESVIPQGSDELGQFLLPTVGRGYRNDPERTAAVFRTIGDQRYVLPGDWGRWNPDGTVTLVGRGTSTINTGGEKVFPEEVQKVALLHEDVEDCLVFGVPDERFGQRVVAVVQPIAGHDVDLTELLSFVRARLAGYKVPRDAILSTVPRAPNGKVLYDEARRLFADR